MKDSGLQCGKLAGNDLQGTIGVPNSAGGFILAASRTAHLENRIDMPDGRNRQ